jgi:hypothetical protein
MTWELLLQNGNRTIELSEIVSKVVFTTTRTGTPGKLDISLIYPHNIIFEEGNPVRFSINGILIFYGFVFIRTKDRWGVREITCYDQTRYLKTNWSYYFEGKSAGQIIRHIANQYNLTCGTIEDTGFSIPHLVAENKSCVDTISKAIEHTIINTGKVFVFFDNGGRLSLREAQNLKVPVVIGDESQMNEYTFKSDIDAETYNQIVLIRPNKDTGIATMRLERDNANVDKWGLLQKYQIVNEQMNDAQISQQARTMLRYFNRPLRTLDGECVGHPTLLRLRAGNMPMLNVPDLDDLSLSRFVMLDRVVHTFEQDSHTIKFDTRTLYT